MAILQSTENEAANLKLVPSSQKHEWIRFTGPREPSSYSISLCLMNLIHAIWLLVKCSGEYFSCACQNGVALIDTRNSARSLPQEKLDEDEGDLFPEQKIGDYHRIGIRKFGKLWEQNSGRESGRLLKLGVSECSGHILKSLHEERTIEAFENWLVEESKIAESLPKLGVFGQDFLSVLITVGTKREYTVPLFRWVMRKYPDMYMRADNWPQKQSLLAEAHSRPSYKAFVICLLKDYPSQTAKMLEFDNSTLLDVIPVMVEQDCSEPIFARLNPTVLITTDSEKNSLLHLVCEYGMEEWKSSEDLDRWNEKCVRLIKNLLTYCPSAIGLTNSSKQSAYQHRIRTFAACKKRVSKEKSDPSIGFGHEPRELGDDKILTLLKERTMALKGYEIIVSLLYGKIQRREIHLDLTELGHISRPVSDSAVKDLVRGVEFESILKHVRIPSFKVVVHPHSGNRYNDQEQQQLMRKGNVKDIFNILLEKGVKKIISLSVDDDEDSPHSDEVIESLEKFDIEEWDWRRKDLCSSVILKAARNARKVSLYSTGNKAVLRSWSAPDGLNSLKKLTDVHVLVQPQVETPERTNLYLDGFISRLEENKDKDRLSMNLVTRIQPVINAQTHIEGRERLETNTWLDNMDRNVIVGTRPYYFSSNGHGTLIAKTIRRLCPKAKLYVARLDQGVNGEPTIESAIKAISWATAMGVDIISMSWTFPELRDTESRKLSEVIDEAHKNKILTFASVSDQGYNQPDISFPGKIPGVFRIGAAQHSGGPDDLSQGYDFVFPGGSSVANVGQSEEGNTDANSNMVLGSSFATAVASGLAALILNCVELCDLGDEYGNDIRQYRNLKDIFHVMASGSLQSSYIQAEKWFPASFENKDWMEDEDQDEFRRRITAIIAPCIVNRPC